MRLIDLETYTDKRGHLTVIEKAVPFEIKRIFYIYGVDDSVRGGHSHKKTKQAAICLQGSCLVYQDETTFYELNRPSKCLLIEPEDWHKMAHFSKDAILMVLASEYYDESDYIYRGCMNTDCVNWREHFYLNNCQWSSITSDGVVHRMTEDCPDYK